MGFGLIALTGCVCTLAYMKAKQEGRQEYTTLKEDGSFGAHKRTSRWD